MTRNGKLLQFVNCFILRDHRIIKEDMWVRDGKIVDPEKVFFDEKISADEKIDCKGLLIAPGFIDLQINGGFGIDFSNEVDKIEEGVRKVAKGILAHGVTSFCPTVVTSPSYIYKEVLPKIRKCDGSCEGATVLGIHVEGPFINKEKKGAHPSNCIQTLDKGYDTVLNMYGNIDNVKIVTLAPEIENAGLVIETLTAKGITVSLGHSMANLHEGETAVGHGACFITHLFNAMLPFHHRDPGLVGLLTSDAIPNDKTVYFGIISDGIHTHPAALRIAHRTHPKGLVLVTDAISAMGLEEGTHRIGQMAIEVRSGKAFVAGTNTLCGSIATMDRCVKFFQEASSCSIVEALEAASLHPALAIGIADSKGTLNYGADADFILVGGGFEIISTWIAGKCVYDSTVRSEF
ncbi:N-acetylglucosamine-6-phosphate deacetylase [Ischnura elegans]|uniref:N-acetylglucosamine-6-phosphate deacetylase n=1 Tax=Ischnura elegans TaxID=197161 RepID=UPI001ED8675F|nr:N-acetylglucosamine-6-phosphate deacetylase [Ischnura elegans]XP_046394766.1 N-acetylglucosamine-6-phosphate deacetylase [Ischnura elegans]XP_046394767.1 N-acetylglucosamine-6-phosphate deacetylase [Ischnura elegans]XP_046394768.1 N-acetylglucosamine-6-phosphate deacetylase [Ischnura elegans]XP_046394769.1 N-acetylglucosamine-6-phosphate deacetylase [Ischnura elegans]